MDQRDVDPGTLDLLPDGVVALDHAGNVVAANERARHLLDLEPVSIGRPLDDVLDLYDESGDRLRLPPALPRVGRRLAERVVTVRSRDGRLRPVAVTGQVTGHAWVLSIRSAGRREAMDRVHGDVVATVSHEIRSPLTSVKGFTSTLLSRWDRLSDEQKVVMLETIDADADRIARLLRDLLEVSRIDAGRVTLRRSRVDVAALAASAVGRATHHAAAAGRDLSVLAAPDLPELHADRDRLDQVLNNLLDNALKYAPHGAVTVAVERLPGTRGGAHEGILDGVRITVADEGPGISRELRDRIFQKFARGHDTRATGTGLGLYISRGLVRAHGGRIELDETARGASFRIELPCGSDGDGRR